MTEKRFLLIYDPSFISAADIGKAQEDLEENSIHLTALPCMDASVWTLVDLDSSGATESAEPAEPAESDK
jgi:hypothetical protein